MLSIKLLYSETAKAKYRDYNQFLYHQIQQNSENIITNKESSPLLQNIKNRQEISPTGFSPDRRYCPIGSPRISLFFFQVQGSFPAPFPQTPWREAAVLLQIRSKQARCDQIFALSCLLRSLVPDYLDMHCRSHPPAGSAVRWHLQEISQAFLPYVW